MPTQPPELAERHRHELHRGTYYQHDLGGLGWRWLSRQSVNPNSAAREVAALLQSEKRLQNPGAVVGVWRVSQRASQRTSPVDDVLTEHFVTLCDLGTSSTMSMHQATVREVDTRIWDPAVEVSCGSSVSWRRLSRSPWEVQHLLDELGEVPGPNQAGEAVYSIPLHRAIRIPFQIAAEQLGCSAERDSVISTFRPWLIRFTLHWRRAEPAPQLRHLPMVVPDVNHPSQNVVYPFEEV